MGGSGEREREREREREKSGERCLNIPSLTSRSIYSSERAPHENAQTS